MRIFLLCAAITFALTIPVQAKSYELASPSGKLKLQIEAAQTTSFSLSVNGKPALENPAVCSGHDEIKNGVSDQNERGKACHQAFLLS